jgi:hypothetical protein
MIRSSRCRLDPKVLDRIAAYPILSAGNSSGSSVVLQGTEGPLKLSLSVSALAPIRSHSRTG